jgi:hypothetical protein
VYHNGTTTGGVATYENSEAVAKFIVAKYPGYNAGGCSYCTIQLAALAAEVSV